MALQVSGSYVTPIGTTVPGVYWRWVGLGIDVSRATANVTLYGYVDAAAFAQGKQSIATKQLSLSGEQFAAVAGQLETPSGAGLSATIYSYLKANEPDFATAVDPDATASSGSSASGSSSGSSSGRAGN